MKLMSILAHPDDETLGTGGTLAKYATEGIETYLIMATRGELGWPGAKEDNPGGETLGRIRAAELEAAAEALGLREVTFLDYHDGALDRANPAEVIAKLVAHLRRIRPQVVITFDPKGIYGHPDHIAISQFTMAAVVAAASPTYQESSTWPAHQVSKLYYRIATPQKLAAYQTIFGELVMEVDGLRRSASGWEDWVITTRIDTAAYWQQVWQAVTCHRSQLPGYQALKELPEAYHQAMWGCETYYRAFSLVNGGRTKEDDLFEGLR